MTEWKRIKYAPKDGSKIWAIESGSDGIFEAWFEHGTFWTFDGETWPLNTEWWQPLTENKPKHPGRYFRG